MIIKSKKIILLVGIFVLTSLIILSGCDTAVKEHTLSIIVNSESAGTVIGAGNYTTGTEIDISALTNEGFRFKNWTVNGEEIETKSSFKYSMPDSNVTLTANFYQELSAEDAWNNAEALESNLINDLGNTYYLLLDLAPWISFPQTPDWLQETVVLYSKTGSTTDFEKTAKSNMGQSVAQLDYKGKTDEKQFFWSGEGEFTINEELNEQGELIKVEIENDDSFIEVNWTIENKLELQINDSNDSLLKNIDWADGQAAESSLIELANYLNEIDWDPRKIVPEADRSHIMLTVGAMDGLREGPILGIKEPYKSIIKNILTGGVGTLINHI